MKIVKKYLDKVKKKQEKPVDIYFYFLLFLNYLKILGIYTRYFIYIQPILSLHFPKHFFFNFMYSIFYFALFLKITH